MLRTERLLEQTCIWYPRTLALLALLWGGLWAASRIHVRARHKLLLASAVILCSLGEQLLVQATWVHYADKPESAGLYREPEWLPRLKQQVGDGSVLCYTSHRDKDYFHDNHLSSFGIKQAEGYETVRPKRLHALQDILTHPEAARQGRHFPPSRQPAPAAPGNQRLEPGGKHFPVRPLCQPALQGQILCKRPSHGRKRCRAPQLAHVQ